MVILFGKQVAAPDAQKLFLFAGLMCDRLQNEIPKLIKERENTPLDPPQNVFRTFFVFRQHRLPAIWLLNDTFDVHLNFSLSAAQIPTDRWLAADRSSSDSAT